MSAVLYYSLLVVMPQRWAGSMWGALWQGSAALAVVWIICRAFPRIPANTRCWLWRLGLMKPFLQLLAAPQIDLACLPRARTVLASVVSQRFAADLPTRCALLIEASRPMMALWSVGVAAVAASILAALARSSSIAERCAPMHDDELGEVVAELCLRIGVSARPDTVVADWASVPMILRRSRGYVMVVPSDLLISARHEDLRLALAHELAHIKRKDLAWNWLPAAAKALFFVNPLVWVAGRELGIAQEMACDEMAVRASGAGLARYGKLLLTMVKPRRRAEPTWAVATVSAGASAKVMGRRLIELGHAQDPPALKLARSVVALLIVCALVMPFQIVEAPRNEAKSLGVSMVRTQETLVETSERTAMRIVVERSAAESRASLP